MRSKYFISRRKSHWFWREMSQLEYKFTNMIPILAIFVAVTVAQTPVSSCGNNTCYLDNNRIDPHLEFLTDVRGDENITENCYPEWTSLHTFKCPDNSTLSTTISSSFCDSSRAYTWYPDIYDIQCIGQCFVPSSLPSNVSFTGSSGQQDAAEPFSHGDRVTYYCSDGLLSPFSMTHCDNGSWVNSEVPNCLADCTLPPYSTNMDDVDSSSVSHGVTLRLSCLNGYEAHPNSAPVTTTCNNGLLTPAFGCSLITTANPLFTTDASTMTSLARETVASVVMHETEIVTDMSSELLTTPLSLPSNDGTTNGTTDVTVIANDTEIVTDVDTTPELMVTSSVLPSVETPGTTTNGKSSTGVTVFDNQTEIVTDADTTPDVMATSTRLPSSETSGTTTNGKSSTGVTVIDNQTEIVTDADTTPDVMATSSTLTSSETPGTTTNGKSSTSVTVIDNQTEIVTDADTTPDLTATSSTLTSSETPGTTTNGKSSTGVTVIENQTEIVTDADTTPDLMATSSTLTSSETPGTTTNVKSSTGVTVIDNQTEIVTDADTTPDLTATSSTLTSSETPGTTTNGKSSTGVTVIDNQTEIVTDVDTSSELSVTMSSLPSTENGTNLFTTDSIPTTRSTGSDGSTSFTTTGQFSEITTASTEENGKTSQFTTKPYTSKEPNEVTCSQPEVESPVSVEPNQELYLEGEQIKYECSSGNLVGNPSAICTDQGFYPPSHPYCQEQECADDVCRRENNGYCNQDNYCVCEPGLIYRNNTCIEKSSVKVIISLDATYIESYGDSSSKEFKELEADICLSFEKAFDNGGHGSAFIFCFVLSFNSGSVIANVVTEVTESSGLTAEEIAEEFTGQANNNSEGYKLPGMKYEFTEGTPVTATELDSCAEGLHTCDKTYGLCRPTGYGRYTCQCVDGTDQDLEIKVNGTSCYIEKIPTGVVIGVSVASGCSLAVIVAVCALLSSYIKSKSSGLSSDEYLPDVAYSDKVYKTDNFYTDDTIDTKLVANAKVIENMTNFNPIPKTSFNRSISSDIEEVQLSELNENNRIHSAYRYNGSSNI